MFTPRLHRCVSLAMTCVLLLIYAPLPSALAAMIDTESISAAESTDTQRQKVVAFLQRAEVVEMLKARGIDPAEAAARVASLKDSEVDRLARHIDQLPAGGSLLETIAVLAIIFFLVLLILELTGVIDVFTFVNSPSR
jgi:hypothetical protein